MLTRPHRHISTPAESDAEVAALTDQLLAPRARALVSILLFLIFFGVYFAGAARVISLPVAKWRNDPLFHADPARVIRSLTGPREIVDHQRTNVHPLFSILYNPIGAVLTAVLGDYQRSVPVLIAACGALCVVLARSFFSNVGFEPVDAVILASVLGVTSSHAFFAVLPETYIFTAASLIALFCTAVWKVRAPSVTLTIGVIAFGNLITNIVQCALARLFARGLGRFRRGRLASAFAFCMAIIAISVLISLAQLALYPRSTLFFFPRSVSQEGTYTVGTEVTTLARRAEDLVLHLTYFSIAAPPACVLNPAPPHRSLPTVTFERSECSYVERFSPLFPLAYAMWSILLVGAVSSLAWSLRHGPPLDPVIAALGLSAAAHFVLHLLYGHDLFLYSATWTFEILAVVGLLVKRIAYSSPRRRLAFRGFLLAFLGVLAAHSLLFVASIIDLYQRGRL